MKTLTVKKRPAHGWAMALCIEAGTDDISPRYVAARTGWTFMEANDYMDGLVIMTLLKKRPVQGFTFLYSLNIDKYSIEGMRTWVIRQLGSWPETSTFVEDIAPCPDCAGKGFVKLKSITPAYGPGSSVLDP